jgi:hypothetical protein
LRPLMMPVSISSQGAWQIAATTFFWSKKARMNSSALFQLGERNLEFRLLKSIGGENCHALAGKLHLPCPLKNARSVHAARLGQRMDTRDVPHCSQPFGVLLGMARLRRTANWRHGGQARVAVPSTSSLEVQKTWMPAT